MKKGIRIVLLSAILVLGVIVLYAQNRTFSEYEMVEFEFRGHPAKIVFPKQANEGRNWIWRARFWGHEPQTDLVLLEKGFHVVYVDVADLYGNKEAVKRWNNFYKYLVNEYDLNKKVVLEGMSRGGLIVYNWASKNTKKVACIYADAPVCDIKSWPGGLFKGSGSPGDWKKCLNAHKLDEKSVLKFKGIPVYAAVTVAKAGIPAFHVCGAADNVVPYEENTKLLVENFRKSGGEIEVILKEGVGHHPHSLKDPKPIVEFILNNTIY